MELRQQRGENFKDYPKESLETKQARAYGQTLYHPNSAKNSNYIKDMDYVRKRDKKRKQEALRENTDNITTHNARLQAQLDSLQDQIRQGQQPAQANPPPQSNANGDSEMGGDN